MTYENKNVEMPATEPNPQVEETTLEIEQLEARIAPSAVWGD